jgi:isopenicillin-N epimerase
MTELTALTPLSPDSPEWYAQMVAVPLPDRDIDVLKNRLYDEYRIEAPLVMWNGRCCVRASFQGYNTHEDLDKAIEAFRALLQQDNTVSVA